MNQIFLLLLTFFTSVQANFLTAQNTQTVTSCHPHSWTKKTVGISTLDLVEGPYGMPYASGSLQFACRNGDNASFRYGAVEDPLLSEIQFLEYWTYVEQTAYPAPDSIEAPYLILHVEGTTNGNPQNLVYFPKLQSSPEASDHHIQPHDRLSKFLWQKWDLLKGVWIVDPSWSHEDSKAKMVTLKSYIAENPKAHIANERNQGIQLTAGNVHFPKWVNYIGYVDGFRFRLATTSADTIYDFEPAFWGAGLDKTIQAGQMTTIGRGAKPGVMYSWIPSLYGPAFDRSKSNPSITPPQTTTYSLLEYMMDSECINESKVTVTVKK